MGRGIDRREFLSGAAGVAAAASLGGAAGAARAMRSGPAGKRPGTARNAGFAQGVASGEPTARAITLWTLLDGLERSAKLELEVARDPDFKRVVERRPVLAAKRAAHSVHARVKGLEPAETYFYRFDTGDRSSPVGRFKTLPPAGSKQPVRIGIFSCQDYVPGYYTAHAGLAAEPDLDLVVCLGDYIYERVFYEPAVRDDKLGANGHGEVQTLKEYRQKYALYHSDANLRAVRERVPLAAIWDDHEVEDNYAATLPGAATLDPRVEFVRRRRNGYRAYFEHMPFRPVRARSRERRRKDGKFRIYRSIKLGGVAELLLLDQRQYRGDQPCGDEIPPVPPCPPEERDDPSRSLLGETQKRWLLSRLERSRASWKLIGSQVMAMALDVPAGNPVNMDQWDGYGAERREICERIAASGIEDVSILTGDIHTFFAGEVTPTGRKLDGAPTVATEFVAGSMTSLGIPETVQGATGTPLPPETIAVLSDSEAFRAQNPHFTYVETENRGYAVLEASADGLDVSYRSPLTTSEPESEIVTLQRFRVERGTPRVELV